MEFESKMIYGGSLLQYSMEVEKAIKEGWHLSYENGEEPYHAGFNFSATVRRNIVAEEIKKVGRPPNKG